jgi:hypothetical protein
MDGIARVERDVGSWHRVIVCVMQPADLAMIIEYFGFWLRLFGGE